MKPILLSKSADDDAFLESLIDCITAINCAEHFTDHLGRSQSEQAPVVRRFQTALCKTLTIAFPAIAWSLEHSQDSSKDAIDIFGKHDTFLVVIELDKHRADQVAKKFVSRSAMFIEQKLYYVSVCYPGTERMNSSECVKYFGFCADVSRRLGNVYVGFIIQEA